MVKYLNSNFLPRCCEQVESNLLLITLKAKAGIFTFNTMNSRLSQEYHSLTFQTIFFIGVTAGPVPDNHVATEHGAGEMSCHLNSSTAHRCHLFSA